MSTLVIDRAGMQLDYESGALVLRQDGMRLRSVPARLLERVILHGGVRLDCSVLGALAQEGASVIVLAGRRGQRAAHLVGGAHGDARARIAQCQRVGDEAFGTEWSRRLLRAKLAGGAALLRRARQARPDLRKPLTDAIATLQACRQRLVQAADRASLRGIEGAAAAGYFAGYARLFAPALGFSARRRRPPPDPVNACLSLGYTLLQAEAERACWIAGLDPLVGLLHLPAHGRASMACDLVEPWRSRVDALVWTLFREGVLREAHFGRDGSGACLLGKTGRSYFYQAWANQVGPLSRALRRHARLAARQLAAAARWPDDAPGNGAAHDDAEGE